MESTQIARKHFPWYLWLQIIFSSTLGGLFILFFWMRLLTFFRLCGWTGKKSRRWWPAGRTWGPITFYWVGVGKRSIACFVALDALFKMGIGLWGRFPAVAAPEQKIWPEWVQTIADSGANLGPAGILGQNPPKILVWNVFSKYMLLKVEVGNLDLGAQKH